MKCDLPGCLDRFLIGSVNDQLSDRHLGPSEGAGFVELSELADVSELAKLPARFGNEPVLQLGPEEEDDLGNHARLN
jgi:hypothetical protein